MADTTIPNLTAVDSVAGTALLVVDTGTQTFKITAQNLAGSLQSLMDRKTVERIRGNGNYTVPTGVTEIRVRAIVPPVIQAITPMGNAFGWGINFEGGIGDGTSTDRSSPVAVVGGHIFSWKPLFHGQALKPDGTAWGTGANSYGQLGVGSIMNIYSPVPVAGGRVFDKIINDNGTNPTIYALDRNGAAFAWGLNGDGRIGDGTAADRSSPVAVVGGHYFHDIFAGSQTVYGLKADGSVWAWGSPGSTGALGNGAITDRSSPVAVVGGHKFVKVAANTQNFNVYGLKADGSVWAWGSGSGGLLGDGTTGDRSSPVAVIGGHVFIDVVSHGNGAYALKADGSVWSWGGDVSGSMGIGLSGLSAYRSSPVAVIGGHLFKRIQIHPGGSFPMALKEDGSVWTWGDNGGFANGPMGTGTTIAYSSPVAVVGGREYVAVLTFPQQTYFLTREGKIYACGANGTGQLGDGTVANRSSPVAVIGNYTFGRQNPQKEVVIQVKAGDILPFSSHLGYFGAANIGRDAEEIEIEYWIETT